MLTIKHYLTSILQTKKNSTSDRNEPKKDWMTAGILTSTRKKSSLYKRYIQYTNELNKQNFITYRNMYKKIIFEAKKLYYNDILKSHINDSKMTWQIINKLTGN